MGYKRGKCNVSEISGSRLPIAAEMTDASNAKLNAELQYVNATINAMFQYFGLLKAAGEL